RDQQELERNQRRWVGTGSADTTTDEFARNVHRDTLASFIGHPPLLQYASIGLGLSREQTRVHLLERMVDP
ncbi:splicing factor 3B subunit 5/RDS3 complex subunit 10, partial [Periconia macrospinosa]